MSQQSAEGEDRMERTERTPRLATVAAVIVTRNRIPLLRKTLDSIKESQYKVSEIVVSDDSTNRDTQQMLAKEYPEVLWLEGPHRGISANRNHGMSATHSDYILLSDDDIHVDSSFIGLAVQKAEETKASLVFAAINDEGRHILPNGLGFLGFSNKPYKSGSRYRTANQQCFIVSRALIQQMRYDEVIEAYGYEEMDFAYRVTASDHRIECVHSCVNIHLAPQSGPGKREKDACRLYVTYKRLAYVDHRRLTALLFVLVAFPHHVMTCIRRDGLNGITQALSNFQLASQMLKRYRSSS
jgi:GT2 family glycosyltransferase